MRLISWNCATGFAAKRGAVAAVGPDVLIVPECSQADAVAEVNVRGATFQHWQGSNVRKGLAVFAYGASQVTVAPVLDETIEYVVPFIVTSPLRLHVLAVWTHRGAYRTHSTETCGYVGQLHRALSAYRGFLTEWPSLVIGDFNSNVIWDDDHQGHSHSDLVARFDELGMGSVYHSGAEGPHGSESVPTHYFRRDMTRPFHIDYCYASRALVARGTSLEIGSPARWLALSDHMPLIVDIRN